jgi:hypothetical protein
MTIKLSLGRSNRTKGTDLVLHEDEPRPRREILSLSLSIFSFCCVQQQKNPDSKKGPALRLASLNCSAYADGTQIM